MEWAFFFLISFVLLFVLVIVLAILQIGLKIQIYKVTDQLHAVLDMNKKELVTISLGDRGLENLAEEINKIIIRENVSLIEIKRREDKLKEDISCLSHDLRTPLTSIRGYLKLLEHAPAEEWEKYMEVVFQKALKLEYLIDEFYQISLLEDGRYLFEYEDIDIAELLTELLLENYSLFQERGITPEIGLPDRPVFIRVDKKACIRIIQNLLFNALDETSGGIQIQLAAVDEKVCLTVRNPVNDFVISELDRIFERFYRKDRARGNGHSGQGLYVVKKLLTEMNCDEPQASIVDNCFSISVKWRRLCDKCIIDNGQDSA